MFIIKKINKIIKLIKNKTWRKGIIQNIAANIELESLIKNLKFKTVFDIGSNKGQFILLIEGLFKGCKIYSLEPINELIQKQKIFFKTNKNITFLNYGIGSHNTYKTLFITNRKDSSSFLKVKLSKKNKDYEIIEKRTIKIKTLDNLFINTKVEKPALVKIDVQGYELEVLKGGKEFLNKISFIIVEVSNNQLYLNQPLELEIEKFLINLNFIKVNENKTTLINGYNVSQKDILFKKITNE